MTAAIRRALPVVGLWACAGQTPLPDAPPPDKCAANAFSDTEFVAHIDHGGRSREFLVWMPKTAGPHDIVVNLHEFRASPRKQAVYSGWIDVAQAENAILVAPEGSNSGWNAGTCCGPNRDPATDEVAFLDAVVHRVQQIGCGSDRVLATGLGNGAMMAERWACESSVPDAVVSVFGSLQVDTCPRATPVPVLNYARQTQDPGLLPVSHATSAWQGVNGAVALDRIEDGTLRCDGWDGGAVTRQCTVLGSPGTWPGAADGELHSAHPLANATRGAWAWVKDQWQRGATDTGIPIPPFSPDKLREGLPLGTRMRYLFEAEGEPARTEAWEVTAADARGCTITTTTRVEEQTVGEPEAREYTWEELAAHARFEATATRRETGEVAVPAGRFPALRYRVAAMRDGQPTETEYQFAANLPGPPALLVVRVGGQERSRMTLLERSSPPPPAPPGDTPAPAPP